MSCIDDNTVDICFVHNSFSSKNITSSVLLSMCYVFTLHETCSMYDDNDVVVVLSDSVSFELIVVQYATSNPIFQYSRRITS